MGNIKKLDGVYYIEFYARGLLYAQAAGTDFDRARQMLSDIESKIAQGEALTIERHIILPVFFEQYFQHLITIVPLKTAQRYQQLMGHFYAFLKSEFKAVERLSDVTPQVCIGYRMYLSKDHRPEMVNFSLLLLRDVLDYGIKLAFINDNPMFHVPLFAWTPNKIKNGPKSEQIKELLKGQNGLLKVSLLLGFTDVLKVMHYRNFIPTVREDMYN